jgi:hypothetical protein
VASGAQSDREQVERSPESDTVLSTLMPALALWQDYTRREVHDIFSPDATFQPSRGPFGISGLIALPDRPGDFVFFVSFGRSQAHHEFVESITEDGVLSWQSQPAQTLAHRRIRELIAHDERLNAVHLFLRTSTRPEVPYTYMGPLAYLTHDATRERPVYFQWQLLEWPPPGTIIDQLALEIAPSTESESSVAAADTLVEVEPPAPAPGRSGTTTREFVSRKRPSYADRDARNAALGLAGELLVLKQEIARLQAANRSDLAEHVIHTSLVEGDSAGYDIRSFTVEGELRHIEVKATRGRNTTAFFVTANEVAFSSRHPDTYRLYRLFEFHPELGSAKYYVIEGSLEEQFELEPTEFRVRMRTRETP